MANSTYHMNSLNKTEMRKKSQEVEVKFDEWDVEDSLDRPAGNRSANLWAAFANSGMSLNLVTTCVSKRCS